MALVFCINGDDADLDKYYANYTGGTDWNKGDPRFPAPRPNFKSSLSIGRTEQGLKEVLTGFASRFVLKERNITSQSGKDSGQASSLLDLISHPDLKVHVLKGIHQENSPHITMAFAGQLYQVNFRVA